MRQRLLMAFLLAGAAVVAPAAQAQDARLAARVPAEAVAPIDAIVRSAQDAGLPTEPLIDRALEGASKRASADLIVRAVERLAGELRAARDAMGQRSSAAEITAGASALRAGADPEALTALRERRGTQSLLVPVAVLADLVAVGVPADTAIAAVTVLAAGFDDAQYIAFRRNVERDIGLGASPVSAIGVRLEATTDAFTSAPTPSAPTPRKP